jgi:hypothetical protein
MEGKKMEIGTTYYVLGLTQKGHWMSQSKVPFPIIHGTSDERIPPDSKALQVFDDHKRATEYLEREIPIRTGEGVREFSLGCVDRHEVELLASDLGADYILVEEADGSAMFVEV